VGGGPPPPPPPPFPNPPDSPLTTHQPARYDERAMSDAPFQSDRQAMVAQQLADRGIHAPRVLEAMAQVPRERFVLPSHQEQAYADRALPIGCQQTISQPYMVGLMTSLMELAGTEKVLEVGTGSGYQAAVLSRLASQVVTIERFAELSKVAAAVLAELGCANVTLVVGDGTLGWPPEAPYDRIIVTAAAETCPPALLEQLADPGILVIPVGPAYRQMLEVHRKREGKVEVEEACPCRFVPLVGGD
jgi:protein-L-isoaspartate(D-aspartate) O-methyltransferase